MVTTRRNGGSTPSRSLSNPQIPQSTTNHTTMPSPPPSSSSSSTSTLTALTPTTLEVLLLATHPLLLLLGSLFALLDPAARSAPYNPTTQSHPPSQAPAYFALKSNVLNVYFVKVTWLWVTLAYGLFLFLHPSNGPFGARKSLSSVLTLTPKRVRGLVRYAIVTLWWILVTQWCFGPALIDRGFRVTGGACELAAQYEGQGGTREFVTSQACKSVGGEWKGGHDISGHVFILVLGSASLALELLPLFARRHGWREERKIVGKNGEAVEVGSEMSEEGDGEEQGGVGAKVGMIVPDIVIGLSWWMLLMTAAYFHTWFEKFTGLLTAWAAIFVVFFLPRIIPGMRDIVGLPGV